MTICLKRSLIHLKWLAKFLKHQQDATVPRRKRSKVDHGHCSGLQINIDSKNNSNRPLEHTPDPQPHVYDGNPSIFVFWGTWGMFQGSVGIFLD